MAGLRETIGNRVLKNKLKSFQRETRVHNFKTAESAVVLFDAAKKDAFKIIWEFRGFLMDKGISCIVYGYDYSHTLMTTFDPEWTNSILAYTKFSCKPDKII